MLLDPVLAGAYQQRVSSRLDALARGIAADCDAARAALAGRAPWP